MISKVKSSLIFLPNIGSLYPKSIFRLIRPVHVHLKTDKVDLKKSHYEKKFFLNIFAIHSSSRHEKRCRMLGRIFCLFQCSRNIRWSGWFGQVVTRNNMQANLYISSWFDFFYTLLCLKQPRLPISAQSLAEMCERTQIATCHCWICQCNGYLKSRIEKLHTVLWNIRDRFCTVSLISVTWTCSCTALLLRYYILEVLRGQQIKLIHFLFC